MNADLLVWVAIGIIAAALVYVARNVSKRLGGIVPREESIVLELNELKATVNTLRRQLDSAEQRIRVLETENATLRDKVISLEKALQDKIAELAAMVATEAERIRRNSAPPVRPLLVIVGTEQKFFERDRSALRRAGVPFMRLSEATKESVRAELRRRRQAGDLYPWVLISAHGGPPGIELSDGIAGPEFWGSNLDGVQVVLLASCSSDTTADDLAGLVDCVVWFKESVGNQDAADFSYAFWRRMVAGAQPRVAFAESLHEVPAVAEFVDIRLQ